MKGIKKTGGGNRAENRTAEGPNPLLHYVMLTVLMSYLPVPDLRRCRLVNSTWRAAATPYLKKNSWLKISGCHGSNNNYLEGLFFTKRNANRESGLTELGLFGIENFFADLVKFLRSSSARRILLKFLEDYGSNMKKLRVNISDETLELLGSVLNCLPNIGSLSINFERDFNPKTVWRMWPSSTLPRGLPSVKRIIVVNNCNSPQVRGSIEANNYYNFLKRLLEIAPSLETLKLQHSPLIQMPNWSSDHTAPYQSKNLYLQLLKDEGKAICPQLKDIYLSPSDHLSPWDMKLVLELDIKFRQIGLPNLNTEAIPDVGPFILNLLERHQSSLEVLELRMSSAFYHTTIPSPFTLQFPCLPRLTKLVVELYNRSTDRFRFANATIRFDPVDYATQFPALNHLRLLYDSNETGKNPRRFEGRVDFYSQFFPEDGQVCPTLQRLSVQIPHPKSKGKPAAYLQFSRRLDLMFPNVHNQEEVKACRALNQAGKLNHSESKPSSG